MKTYIKGLNFGECLDFDTDAQTSYNVFMNILSFCYEFPPKIFGGLGTYGYYISKAFKNLKHNVTVYTVNWENKLNVVENLEGIAVVRPKWVDDSPAMSLYVADELRGWGDWLTYFSKVLGYSHLGAYEIVLRTQQTRKKRTDRKPFHHIVASHDWLGITGGLIVQKAIHIPLVFHIHSLEIGRQKSGGSLTIKRMEEEGLKRADHVITVSNAMKKQIMEFAKIPEEKISVVWNGVDEKKYDMKNIRASDIQKLRKFYNIAGDELFILFIGRLTEVKGAAKLVESMPDVIKKHKNAKLVMLGEGELKNEVEKLIAHHHLKNNVTLRAEFVSEKERILHYAASDIAVFPSLYEPFGIVSLEAMAMKKSVVVGVDGVSGFKEQVLTEGKDMCGAHVDPHEPQSIAWGINLLLEIDRKKLGENARKRVLAEFTWEHAAQKTIAVYENAIKKQKKSPAQK